MKKRKHNSTLPLLITGIFLAFTCSCEKKDDIGLNVRSTAIFNPDVTYGTMTDQDGNTYKTITVGTQTWMAENLYTTKYNDGTSIPHVIGSNDWRNLTTGAYCSYNNETNLDSIATYGYLYNWYAVNTGKLAPKGWHVPTESEWLTLIDYVGGEDIAGEKLRESSTKHWPDSPYTSGTNEVGFTSLPGGSRDMFNGSFEYFGTQGYWWSSTEYNADRAWLQNDYFNDADIYGTYFYKGMGYSIRCVKD